MICIPKLALEIQDLLLPATVLLPRLGDKGLDRNKKLPPHRFSTQELVYKLKHNTQHKHPHHEELSPLQRGKFFQVYQIQHVSNTDKGLDKGVVEEIQLNRKNEGEINYFIAAILSMMLINVPSLMVILMTMPPGLYNAINIAQ